MSEWISVKDRVPPPWAKADPQPDAVSYLVTDGERVWVEEMWIAGFCYDNGRVMFDEPPVTHWMPMPDPPR